MKAASLNDVKKELQSLDPKELAEICVALARYKKDNKEYLDFLLFEAHNTQAYITRLKEQIDEDFILMRGQGNLYYTKKSLRKVLRYINKYCKYMGEKTATIDLLIYFCVKLKRSGIPFYDSKLIVNMYEQQLKKIHTLISSLHEDLQMDYAAELAKIED
ncbi:MAG: hypothetical protein K0S33_1993 [Bacteroidetes bacterium]|jgi:hypothetical protein|nr:hypothetical protein [Bacteroidota bacterium]